jgi:hypothetical protein
MQADDGTFVACYCHPARLFDRCGCTRDADSNETKRRGDRAARPPSPARFDGDPTFAGDEANRRTRVATTGSIWKRIGAAAG